MAGEALDLTPVRAVLERQIYMREIELRRLMLSVFERYRA